MTSREELIEKARAAFTEAWETEDGRMRRLGIINDPDHPRSRAGIIAALAVFEEAHTPTDNERFAKSFSGWSPDEVARNPRVAAEVIERLRSRVIDSFRRSEVPVERGDT